MDGYYYFKDDELYRDLAEQLAAAQAENAILQRCCEALQYACEQKEKELQHIRLMHEQSLEQQLNMARVQEKLVEKLNKQWMTGSFTSTDKA